MLAIAKQPKGLKRPKNIYRISTSTKNSKPNQHHLILDPVLFPSTELTGFSMVIVFTTPRRFARSHAFSCTSPFFFTSFSTSFIYACFGLLPPLLPLTSNSKVFPMTFFSSFEKKKRKRSLVIFFWFWLPFCFFCFVFICFLPTLYDKQLISELEVPYFRTKKKTYFLLGDRDGDLLDRDRDLFLLSRLLLRLRRLRLKLRRQAG